MKFDSKHKPWLIISPIVLAAGAIWYWRDAVARPHGPSGGSAPGITFGIIGLVFMLFAALLSVRRRLRTWRIGRAEIWVRAHLYLGFLALPFIWFHGGFHHGGVMTTTLMWLLYLVVGSGILGAILQHVLPGQLTREVPDETVYEQIPLMAEHLEAEAELLAAAVWGPIDAAADMTAWRQERTIAIKSRADRWLMGEQQKAFMLASVGVAPLSGAEPFKTLYRDEIRPFLRDTGSPRHKLRLADRAQATLLFEEQRPQLPPALRDSLSEMERLCARRRDLDRQLKLHKYLHGWLFIHVPLTAALLTLSAVHVWMALRY
ncbi:hypothetical protein BH09PLA1_BH09PLA1_01100 [soil metagenome]